MLRQVAGAAGAAPVQPASKGAGGARTSPAPRTDRIEFGPGWEGAVDWEQAVREVWASLPGQYAGVRFVVADLSDREALRLLASQAGSGAFLVVGRDFLAAMAAGKDAYVDGWQLLHSLAAQLQGQWTGQGGVGAYLDKDSVTFWCSAPKDQPPEKNPWLPQNQPSTLADWMKLSQEKAKAAAEKRTAANMARLLRSIGVSATRTYARLARARTRQEVKSVSYSAGSAAVRVKAAMAQAEGMDREKLRLVLGQMNNAQVQSRRKITALDREGELRLRQKRARERKEALRLEHELQRKKAGRQAKENAMIQNGLQADYAMAELRRKYLLAMLQGDGGSPAGGTLSVDASGSAAVDTGGGVPAGSGGMDVGLSDTVAISLG